MQRHGQFFWRSMVCLVGVGTLLAGVAARAGEGGGMQRSTGSGSQSTPSTLLPPVGAPPADGSDPFRARAEDKRIASAATDRRKRMLDDTDRLLQLATELKDEVDKTTKDEMSVPTIKKAAEIEKLAHDVKERMKGQ